MYNKIKFSGLKICQFKKDDKPFAEGGYATTTRKYQKIKLKNHKNPIRANQKEELPGEKGSRWCCERKYVEISNMKYGKEI